MQTKNKSLPWDVVEKAINKEIEWLKYVIPTRGKAGIISFVENKVRKIETEKNKDLWDGLTKKIIEPKQKHGGEWHRTMMEVIKQFFEKQDYDITVEPHLNYGRADLGVYKDGKNNLYVEIGTVSIYKMWVNLQTIKDAIFLVVPSENFDKFLFNLKENYSAETLYNYERDLAVFEDFLKDIKKSFSKLTKRDILNYKAYLTSIDRKTAKAQKGEKKLSAYSINKMLSALRSYLKYLIEMDYPAPLPPDAVKMVKTIKKKPQVAELEELIKLLEFPSHFEKDKKIALRNRAVLETLFSTGMRISELCNLKLNQIDKEGKIFILGKGKKERFVYLTPRAKKHLDEYLAQRESNSPYVFVSYRGRHAVNEKENKVSTNYLQYKIKRYRELLGINVPTSAHSLRHGFATYLAESGANPAAIQILLGHESLDTTTRYVHASDRYARQVHKKFFPVK